MLYDGKNMTFLPKDFYERCLAHHSDVLHGPNALQHVVAGSIPIPFFGDVAAYFSSELRIVSVGLNPSDKEFKKDSVRFDVERGLSGPEGLEQTLSGYFKENSYGWFKNFEKVLAGVGASYYPLDSQHRKASQDANNTALHVDVCSPIATNPTWSKDALAMTREKLTPHGNQIFKQLMSLLQPDIIIASVAPYHLVPFHPAFSSKDGWTEIIHHSNTGDGKKKLRSALIVRTFHEEEGRAGKRQLLVFGSAADTPFGRFSDTRKRDAGAAILAHWQMINRDAR
jgi:hypothetical protein